MGDGRNRAGGVYALTMFTAILPGRTDDVRDVIQQLPRGADSPLARLPQLHTSRLHILDRLVHQGPSQKPDTLNHHYLVFTAVFDGALRTFLDDLAGHVPEAQAWWGPCIGFPGLEDRVRFAAWVRHNQRDTDLLAVASPHVSVPDVLASLRVRQQLLDFALAAQGMGAAELKQRFDSTFGSDA